MAAERRSPRVRRAVADKRPAAGNLRNKKFVRIKVPAEFAKVRATKPDEAARLQAEVRLEIEHWLARGYAATRMETSGESAEYVLEP